MNFFESKGLQKFAKTAKKHTLLLVFFLLMPHSIIQHYLTKNKKNIYLKIILSAILSVPLVAILTLLIAILFIYKTFVDLILCCRLGSKYHGLITGTDQLITLYKTCGTICIFMCIEDERSFLNLLEVSRKKINEILENPDTDRKLLSTRERFLGYLYFHETNVKVDDILKEFTFGSEDEFMDKYFIISESDLPYNNKFNWDITFCRTPQILGKNKYTYRILYRFHHAIGDGLTFYHILYKLWVKREPGILNYASKLISGANKHSQNLSLSLELKNILSVVKKPEHILFSTSCNKEGVCAIKQETGHNYVEKIKFIKNKLNGISFYNVIIGAISASLTEFFIKYENCDKIPEEILLMTPLQVDLDRVQKLFRNDSNVELCNDFTMCPFNIPIVPKKFCNLKVEDYIFERLVLIKTEFDDIKNSFDMKIIYTYLNVVLGVLPNVIATKLPQMFYSGAVSHVPGGPLVETSYGSKISNVAFIIPKLPEYGFGISFITYDDRLMLGISAGKSKYIGRKELNEILDNVFKYIDIMFNQLK